MYERSVFLDCLITNVARSIKKEGHALVKAGKRSGKTNLIREVAMTLHCDSIRLKPRNDSDLKLITRLMEGTGVKVLPLTLTVSMSEEPVPEGALIVLDEVFQHEASYYAYTRACSLGPVLAVGSRTEQYDQDVRWLTMPGFSAATWDMNPTMHKTNMAYSMPFPEMQYSYGAF